MHKIAIIITNLGIGGAERWVVNTSKLLVDRGCHVDVILLENKVALEVAPGVQLHCLYKNQPVSGSIFFKRKAGFALAKLIKSLGNFDLIISTLPYADQITNIAGLNSTWYRIANTLSQEIKALSGNKARRRLKRIRSLYKNQNIIAVSDGVQKDLVETLNIKPHQIQRIYNPIDTKKVQELAQENIAAIPDEPFLLHSGRFALQKCHDLLLDTWALLLKSKRNQNIQKLVLLTEPRPELEQLITERDLNLHVIITGYQSNPYPWYKKAHCLVLSSSREGMPNVILEALALGTPVASTDCPSGPRELLGADHPNALAPMNDKDALANAIEYALKAKFSDNHTILAPFQPAVVIDQILSLCNNS